MFEEEHIPSPESCLSKGHCEVHGEEIERRRADRRDIKYLKEVTVKLFDRLDNELAPLKIKVFAIFISLGLMLLIVLGSYSFTLLTTSSHRAEMIEFKGDIHSDVDKVENISDARDTLINDRIQQAVKEAKLGREELLTQIIQLMTSDASNKEWQRGVIKQLELLNYNLTGKIPTKSNH